MHSGVEGPRRSAQRKMNDNNEEGVCTPVTNEYFSPNPVTMNPLTSMSIERNDSCGDSIDVERTVDVEKSEGNGNHGRFDFFLFMKVCGFSAVLPFVQIAIPLGNGNQINPTAFIIFQMLYTIWGVVTLRIPYAVAIPEIPVAVNRVAFFCDVSAQLAACIAFVMATRGSVELMDLTRGPGLTIYGIVSLSGLLIFTLRQDSKFSKSVSFPVETELGTIHFRDADIAAADSISKDLQRAHVDGDTLRSKSSIASVPKYSTDRSSSVDSEQRQSSIVRLINLTASVDDPILLASMEISHKNVLMHSCAMRCSIWRSVVPFNKQSGHPNSLIGYNLPVMKWTLQSICMMEFATEELKFKLIGPAVNQFIRLAVCNCSKYLLFLFGQLLTEKNGFIRNAVGDVGFYLIFLFGLSALRTSFQIIGLWIDMHKTGGPSEQQLLDMWISVYYFVFYRGLFVSVDSYVVFAVIKVLHIAQELCSYQLRYTDWFGRVFQRTYDYVHALPKSNALKPLAVIAMGPPLQVHVQRTDITLGLRLYLIIYSCLTFIAFFSFLRYGYNREVYCLFSVISDSQYRRVMTFTAISLVVEVLLFITINNFSARSRGYSSLSFWQRYLTGQLDTASRVPLVLLVSVSGLVVLNYYLAQIDLSSLDDTKFGC